MTAKNTNAIPYNGYKNFATWQVAVQIDNDQGMINACDREANFFYRRGLKLRGTTAKHFVLNMLRVGQDFDSADIAVSRVCWREIAEYITTIGEEARNTRAMGMRY